MIVAVQKPLSVSEEKILRKWLSERGAEILMDVLRSDEATVQMDIANDILVNVEGLSKGDPMPSVMNSKLRQLSQIKSTIKVLSEKLKDGSLLSTITPSIE